MDDNTVKVSIKREIFEKISTRIKYSTTGFSSVDEYVNYVLNEVLNSLNEEINDDDRKKVEEELKKLGYI